MLPFFFHFFGLFCKKSNINPDLVNLKSLIETETFKRGSLMKDGGSEKRMLFYKNYKRYKSVSNCNLIESPQ